MNNPQGRRCRSESPCLAAHQTQEGQAETKKELNDTGKEVAKNSSKFGWTHAAARSHSSRSVSSVALGAAVEVGNRGG